MLKIVIYLSYSIVANFMKYSFYGYLSFICRYSYLVLVFSDVGSKLIFVLIRFVIADNCFELIKMVIFEMKMINKYDKFEWNLVKNS